MKIFTTFLAIFFLAQSFVQGQCSLTLASDSLTACVGDTIFLSATGADTYKWSHDATLSCDTCASPYIILTDTSSYVLIQGTEHTFQWATNGKFTSGNTGFMTNYTYSPTSIWNEGTYAVGPNPNAVHPYFGTWGDHTTGSGNYLLVNGSSSGSKILWRQIINFPAGAQVTMKWWMLTFVTPAGSLQLKQLNNNIGAAASTPSSTGTWAQTSRTFTVPASGQVTLNLVTLSSAVAGNDFGIDDISFEYDCVQYDTVWIAPKSDAQIQLDSTNYFACDSLCFSFTNILDPASDLKYLWVLDNGMTDTNAVFSKCLTDSGNYSGYLLTQSTEGCTDSITLPMLRVGHTRTIDSIVFHSPVGNDVNGTWVMPPGEPMDLQVFIENLNGNSTPYDSLFVKMGSTQWSNPTVERNVPVVSWNGLSISPIPTTICAYLYTAEGCVDSLCKNLAFYPSISVPNFFTPNNDLVNDELEILSSNAEVLIQRIYNRWGNLVFESTDPSVFWDGKVNGALAAAGVYFLEIEAKNAYSEGYPVIERHAVHLIH